MGAYDFNTTDLAPLLLSMPFKVETNWHVLTGASCTGKTTLIENLAERGYRIISESARLYFEREIARGRNVEELLQNGGNLQREIAALQLRNESRCEANEITFLDRAIPDSLTFYRVFGLDPNEILPKCFFRRYATVFILDRLPNLRNRPLGPEDKETSQFLDQWLERDYRALGYRVVRVPAISPPERLAFVLERSSGKDG
jgi:predicted ATPase